MRKLFGRLNVVQVASVGAVALAVLFGLQVASAPVLDRAVASERVALAPPEPNPFAGVMPAPVEEAPVEEVAPPVVGEAPVVEGLAYVEPAPSYPHIGGVYWSGTSTIEALQVELDQCFGFIRMSPYELYGVQPTVGIHNHCGGQTILNLGMGSVFTMSGAGLDGTYQVVDGRDVSVGATFDSIAGMGGDVLLQTCYWDGATMRILGAARIG